jgi:hypothetical protein
MDVGPTMKHAVTAWFVLGAFLALGAQVQGQGSGATAPNPAQSGTHEPIRQEPPSVQVPLVNYFALGGSAKTEFEPTAVTLNAKGLAEVAITKEGSVSVKAQFSGLNSPTQFGNEFLTYILWGITPKGQPLKIGELIVSGGSARLVARTVLRTFGMLITAEPYAVVTQPSNVVVLVGKSVGETQSPSVRCELLRDGYAPSGYTYEPIDTSSGYAPELVQALNARRIAKIVQADKYAEQSFHSAEGLYEYMIAWAVREKKPSKKLLQVANSVSGTYEEARSQALRQQLPKQEKPH